MNGQYDPGDLVQPFQIDNLGVRGCLVRLSRSYRDIVSGHDYPNAVAELLGQSLALTSALAAGLKFDGIFTLQTSSDGPVRLMVADVTSEGELRGYARYKEDEFSIDDSLSEEPVPGILGKGHMAFTVDQGPDTERYQGITELEGATLADCAHAYFRSSEQLRTAVVLAAEPPEREEEGGAAALLVQKLPDEDGTVRVDEEAEEEFRRAVILASTVSKEEFFNPELSAIDILYRLFNQETLRVFNPRSLRHQCRCSRKRVLNALGSFPAEELADLKEDGIFKVTCEFCGAQYGVTEDDLEAFKDEMRNKNARSTDGNGA